ncbi:hypothetical protein BJQ94_06860 [Cryobacterium sp. SO2]|uniref:hypothetical protein n=1 Tax=Cryobacterium sp. SO2 TaxID=1897060 RepID=UPI00223E71FB|nr:hypothetical protein [Cryobacterium sp. SO2]WEO79418.1 hypothetical protein BJQ94_06860 [Cryobacterium sp. SO2]
MSEIAAQQLKDELIDDRAGVSRATAQRHLAALATRGDVDVTLRYGSTGRPEHRYSVRRRRLERTV